MDKRPTRAKEMPSASDRAQQQTRLLIADDHPLLRQAIRTVLSGEPDIEVIEEAQNGLEALQLCRALRPDLILMDVNMPVMDGLEATKKIKQECPKTSILILTVHEDPNYIWEAIRAGAAGYVLKITTPKELLVAVRKVLNGEFAIDQDLAMGMLRRLADETYKKNRQSEEVDRGVGTPPPEKHHEPPTGGSAGSLTASLTAREVEILALVAKGFTNRQIATELSVARNTARNHVQHIISKLEVSDRTQAAVRAIELGLLCATHHKSEE